MKKTYFCEMDEEEVKKIIADHFNVSSDKVRMIVRRKSFGVGPMEHERSCVECRVEMTANQTR